MDDRSLLREYALRNSEEAFQTLVGRYVNLVHSAALRQVGDAHLAEDVTQAVFIILAAKAGQIREGTVLSGWLFKTVRFTASAQIKMAARRHRREQEAHMDLTMETSDDAAWEQVAPMLDEALGGLSEADRRAVLLRYFENKSLAEVGGALAVNEDTARKRIARALEKLRRFFGKRGVVLSVAAIGGVLSTNAVQAAPTGLAAKAAAAAFAKGTTSAASTAMLVKGALKLMAWTKVKLAAALAVAVILATGTTVVVSRSVAQSEPEIGDSAWARADSRVLRQLPPAFILRPTHFAGQGAALSSTGTPDSEKVMGRNITLARLVSLAYGVQPVRAILSADLAAENVDVLMTTADGSQAKLQSAIKEKLGLVAHREMREGEVWLLSVKDSNAPGLKLSAESDGGGAGSGFGSMRSSTKGSGGGRNYLAQGQPITGFILNLQGHFHQPILDQTGLTGKYDISLQWKTAANADGEEDAIRAALLEQLGLDLVPGRGPVEMLIVEKVK